MYSEPFTEYVELDRLDHHHHHHHHAGKQLGLLGATAVNVSDIAKVPSITRNDSVLCFGAPQEKGDAETKCPKAATVFQAAVHGRWRYRFT